MEKTDIRRHRMPAFEIEAGETLTINVDEDEEGRVTWYVRLSRDGAYMDQVITGEAIEDAAIPLEQYLFDVMRKKIAEVADK